MEDLLKKMTYGHYILTALTRGEKMTEWKDDYLAAGTVNWASQLSFHPVQIGVAVAQNSDLEKTISASGHFTLHLLSSRHKDLIEKFAGTNEIKDSKINGVPYRKEGDELVLTNTLGYMKCKVVNQVQTGDHTLYIGEPVEIKEINDTQPTCTMDVPIHYTPDKAGG